MALKKKLPHDATLGEAMEELGACTNYVHALTLKITELHHTLLAEERFATAPKDVLLGPEAIRLLRELRELKHSR